MILLYVLNSWPKAMDKTELEEEIQSLQMTCYELDQKNKQLMRVNAELRKDQTPCVYRDENTDDMFEDLLDE